MWGDPESLCFQEAPCPPGRRQQGEPPGWQGDEGPVAFITRESLDQHKSISPSGKTAPRTCLTISHSQQLGNLAPHGLPFFCSFHDEKEGIS